jgi:hypothetical protein
MSHRKRILFSARDPGAVGHITALTQYFCADGRFDVILTASGVALEMLAKGGVETIPFHLPGGIDFIQPGQDPGPLLREAKKLLALLQPDAVFASLSSMGVGIDEALLATAEIPTFALQDFWGDVNLGLGVPADLYLVMDDFAAELSWKRWGVKALAVGAPKYTLYANLDILAMRQETRGLLGAKPDNKVVGWFGQSPDIPGHEEVLQDFLEALTLVPEKPKLVLKEHPKSCQVKTQHVDRAAAMGLTVVEATEARTTEEWLAACDLVVTVFSACGLDHAFLSAYSPRPLGCVLYLATNEPVRRCIMELAGMERFPIIDQGIGAMVEDSAEIATAIRRWLSHDSVKDYYEKSKRLSAGSPLSAIAECIIQNL